MSNESSLLLWNGKELEGNDGNLRHGFIPQLFYIGESEVIHASFPFISRTSFYLISVVKTIAIHAKSKKWKDWYQHYCCHFTVVILCYDMTFGVTSHNIFYTPTFVLTSIKFSGGQRGAQTVIRVWFSRGCNIFSRTANLPEQDCHVFIVLFSPSNALRRTFRNTYGSSPVT
jgi:hypothetical protein